MALFKCKMCGGNLDVAEGMTVCECEYCGTKQTLPKSSDDQQLNMINRANHFRQQCEFDKAMEIYERMLQKNDSDAEIYWSIVLCRYGIEYVDDPLTKQKIPTCHRAQYTLITQDPDYLEALSHADELQKDVFRHEAEYIANVQKGILEISNKEEPFDVFICYKETDSSGKRTQDSVLAQDLYYQLTQEGFKVFFSRITLEDKLGSAYEPYIFAALNSAKVMVVVGTKPEYYNAVWVRNEWSRYLMLMKEDHSKILIPAYKDMDPYDLPEALSMFQAQDMSKLGFMQDLIRGIKKITGGSNNTNSSKNAGTESASGSKADNLIKRGFMSLEDGDMQKAASYFEQALNEDAEEARAYEGLLLVELNLRSESELENLDDPFDQNSNYKKAVRFADEKLREKLNGYVVTIRNRSLDKTYSAAKEQIDSAKSLDDIKYGAQKLLSIKSWRDAVDILYNTANKLSEENNIDSLKLAVSILTQISDYKDAAQKIDSFKTTLSDIETRKLQKEQAEYEERLNKQRKDFVDGLLTLDMEHQANSLGECDLFLAKCKSAKRKIEASGYDNDKMYSRLVDMEMESLNELIIQCKKEKSGKRKIFGLLAVLSFITAIAILIPATENYKLFIIMAIVILICALMVFFCITSPVKLSSLHLFEKYSIDCRKLSDTVKSQAFSDIRLKALYEKERENVTSDLKGSSNPEPVKKNKKNIGVLVALVCIAGLTVGACLFFGSFIPSQKYQNAITLMNEGEYEDAIAAFSELGEYKDSSLLVEQCNQYILEEAKRKEEEYTYAVALMNDGKYIEAMDAFNQLGDYKDSQKLTIISNAKYFLFQTNGASDESNISNIANIALSLASYEEYETAAMVYNSLGALQSRYKASASEMYYKAAEKYYSEGNYEMALADYSNIDTSLIEVDTFDKVLDCKYNLGLAAYEEGEYMNAFEYFHYCSESGMAVRYLQDCADAIYKQAIDAARKQNFTLARQLIYHLKEEYAKYIDDYNLCEAAEKYTNGEPNMATLMELCSSQGNELSNTIYETLSLDKIEELFAYYSGDYIYVFYYNDNPGVDYTTDISFVNYEVKVGTRNSFELGTIDDYIAMGRMNGLSCQVYARDDGLYKIKINDTLIRFRINNSGIYNSIDVYDSYGGNTVHIPAANYYYYLTY